MRHILVFVTLTFLIVGLMPRTIDAEPYPDVQLWSRAGLRLDLGDRWQMSAYQRLRFDRRVSQFDETASEFELEYELFDGVSLHGGYRFTVSKNNGGDWFARRLEDDWRYEHRLFLGGQYQRDIGPFEFSYRLELQEDLYPEKGRIVNENVVRNRLQAELETFDVVTPFANIELLAYVAGAPGTGIRDLRGTSGIDLEVGNSQFGFFYRLRRAYYEAPTQTDHIFGLQYRYELEP